MSTLILNENRPTAIVKQPVRLGTGSSFVGRVHSDRFLNSAVYRHDSTVIVLQENKQDDDLIRLKEKFNDELAKLQKVTLPMAEKSFTNSLIYLSRIEPDKISVEITNDDSLYFSVIKGNYTIYLEEFIDNGEVIVVMFKNGVKLNSISGNIDYVTSRLLEVTSN